MKSDRVDIERIKKLVIIALVSDDELMETLVLKGGNALLLAYDLSFRASWDLDFSISDDFKDIERVRMRVEASIIETFEHEGFYVFDFLFQPQPRIPKEATQNFWGGYMIQFKFIERKKLEELGGTEDIATLRRNAIQVLPNQSPKIIVEISKYEYVEDKRDIEIDGYTLYVYAPRLIVCEKIRAICQQIPGYTNIIPSFSARPRPRDFYDIYKLMESFDIDIISEETRDIMKKVFDAKRVPCDFIKEIKNNKEIHKQDYASLEDTISIEEKENFKEFDFYFNYVVERFDNFFSEAKS